MPPVAATAAAHRGRLVHRSRSVVLPLVAASASEHNVQQHGSGSSMAATQSLMSVLAISSLISVMAVAGAVSAVITAVVVAVVVAMVAACQR